jgi:hypothetical protein
MRKINATSIILIAYLCIMAYIGFPDKNDTSWFQYIATIVATLCVIGLLRYVQIKRFKKRHKMDNKD